LEHRNRQGKDGKRKNETKGEWERNVGDRE
jgi:hypothetical protein